MNAKKALEVAKGMDMSTDALEKVEGLLSEYEDNAEVSKETLTKILAIVDIEIDATKLAASIYQSGIDLADDFLKKTEG